jgi:hypothetical protein
MHTFPSSHAGLKRMGEVAYRSLYPCLPQVVANFVAVAALSRHESLPIWLHLRPTFESLSISLALVCILPVKPCRQG